MKTVTIKIGSLLIAELPIEDDAPALVTYLKVNEFPVITHMPLVLRLNEPLMITVTDSKGAPGKRS